MRGRNGFIKLHRKLLDSPIWEYSISSHYPDLIAFWVTLLMLVNYEDKKWYDGFQEIIIPAGSLITSNESLASKMGMSVQTTRTCLKHLENMEMITRQATSHYTQVFIVKWAKYQGKNQDLTSQVTESQQTPNKRLTTTKEYKEYKEVGGYSNNTIKISEILGVKPTKGLEKYLNELYPDYKFKELALRLVQWCEENNKKPTALRFMNWVRADDKKGLLERRDR